MGEFIFLGFACHVTNSNTALRGVGTIFNMETTHSVVSTQVGATGTSNGTQGALEVCLEGLLQGNLFVPNVTILVDEFNSA